MQHIQEEEEEVIMRQLLLVRYSMLWALNSSFSQQNEQAKQSKRRQTHEKLTRHLHIYTNPPIRIPQRARDIEVAQPHLPHALHDGARLFIARLPNLLA